MRVHLPLLPALGAAAHCRYTCRALGAVQQAAELLRTAPLQLPADARLLAHAQVEPMPLDLASQTVAKLEAIIDSLPEAHAGAHLSPRWQRAAAC